MQCALQYAKSLRDALHREKPGWTVEPIWCPWHRVEHDLISDIRQRPLIAPPSKGGVLPQNAGVSPSRAGLPHQPRRPANWCRWHETPSPQLAAPCAYCGTQLHVHQDALTRAKADRETTGYVEQRCPACHKYNAVYPAYGIGGIRTSRLAGGAPALQLKLGKS